ncbi:unnamed protein product [Orchesella dallaii]|uniref:Endoplasmic reticulum-Golgi intermediate compartment protein 3 n=1 Tax=Orchesella dallaii TaxID=48710 RepID=A0ABP1QER4_9HEXA
MATVWEKLKELDAYPKPLEDFRIKTFQGGAVTILSTVIMLALFISELSDYLTPTLTEELFVDTSRSNKLRINLGVEFPKVACSYLSIDAMDSSGEQHSQIEHSIFKRRLDADGNPIVGDVPVKTEVLGDSSIGKMPAGSENSTTEHHGTDADKPKNVNDTALAKPQCGSCYGAETSHLKCCNTCEEVQEAYRLKGWAVKDLSLIEQCAGQAEEMKAIFNEGCQIYGYMEVNRVSGSFHIAPGKSFTLNHVHVHDVQPYSSSQFNMTHKIRSLTFGENIPGKTNPIDGMDGVATVESTMFQYYLKIVPFTYEKKKEIILSNQFSTTRHQKAVGSYSGESGMPGVFFQYEISPIMIKYSEKSKSFGHFAVSVCAIIGGVFTVAGLIDSTIYKWAKLFKKLELGKLG